MPPRSAVRWTVLSLVFLATTINYLDRMALAVLLPVMREELHISPQQYGNVTFAFQMAYTFGFLAFGKLLDAYGTRLGYALATVWWSIAAALHALARAPFDLGIWRALLGLGEAGNFPAAIKAVAEWFPPRERALATGIFNSGTSVAAMIGPYVFVQLTAHFGWRRCFLATSALGFIWLVVWWAIYRLPRMHPGVSAAELAHIESGGEPNATRLSWREALARRQTWGFAFAKFFSDPVWWFYLYWLPSYLYDARHFQLTAVAWALPVIYLAADIGSVAGGWLSGYWMRHGWTTRHARLASLGLCAACMPFAAMAVLAENLALTIGLFGLATAAHQGWSANLYASVPDQYPQRAVGTIIGIGGFSGGLGGALFSALVPGYIVQHFGYTPAFLMMGGFHVIGFLLAWLLLWPSETNTPAAATSRPAAPSYSPSGAR